MKKMPSLLSVQMLVVCLSCMTTAAHAEEYSETTVSIGYAPRDQADNIAGTGTNDAKQRTTYRIEHFGTYAFGDNYFAGSVYKVPSGSLIGGDGGGGNRSSMFDFAYVGHLSAGKIFGATFGGPIKDVVLTGHALLSDFYGYRRVGIGPGVMWNVPGVPVLETSLLTYRQTDDNGFRWTKPLLRVYAFKPFEVMGTKFSIGGFMHYRGIDKNKTGGEERLYIEPELLAYFGKAAVGLRIEHHSQQGGGNLNYTHPGTTSRTTTSLVAKYSF